jgi:hypothetical protein
MGMTQVVEEIWVTTSEGAEITGYNAEYIGIIALKMWRLPEEKREIRIRKRSGRYELWLPDLVDYAQQRGPYKKTQTGT